MSSARRLSIPGTRTLALDGLALVPRHVYYPVERWFDLGEVAAAREACTTRISWSVIFLKAYAAVCARRPELRQSYHRWPWPHLMESDEVVGQMVVNRTTEAGDLLCWARFAAPHETPLVKLQQQLQAYQTEPLEQVFRKQLRLAKMSLPIRRLLWWWQLNFSGEKRAKRLGTFSQSTLAGQGCSNRFHQTLLTTSLSYAPLEADGRALVTLICDHRVLDGVAAAAALGELEAELRGAILMELTYLAERRCAA